MFSRRHNLPIVLCLVLVVALLTAAHGATPWSGQRSVSAISLVYGDTPTTIPALLPGPSATPVPVPTVLPPLTGVYSGTVVLSATVSASGTFFDSTRVNGLRIGLRVPTGAVRSRTQFAVTLAAPSAPAPRNCQGPNGAGLGNTYDFTARRVSDRAPVSTFAVALLIRMDVPVSSMKALPNCRIGLAFRARSRWVFLPDSQADLSTGAVTGLTDHFTVFQVRAIARTQPHHAPVAGTPVRGPTVTLPLPHLSPTPTPRPH